MDLSVVIPIKDERDNLRPLHDRLRQALEPLALEYEIVFIDDGSVDGSFELLQELAAGDEHVKVVQLRRNFGQTAALQAGIDWSRGAVLVTMDGDLQNDPADIPALVARLEQGYDMVCGWRRERRDPLSRRLPSWFANKIISWSTGVRLHDYGCSLKAIRSEVVKGLRLYGEMHRFIPAVASWMGVTVAEMPVNHRARTHGRSKYGLGRTFRVLLDLFTVKFLLAYGTRPSHLFGLTGLAFGAVAAVIAAYLLYVKFVQGEAIGGRPLLLVPPFFFITGVLLVMAGLLAELLVRIYHESQGKPTYVVKEQPRTDEPPGDKIVRAR
jgi:glycosyltransferase involved in cell wall biosynthesis